MATLYVTEPGARVEKEYRRLLVSKKDEVLMSVPLAHVSEVVLVGRAGVTTPAMLSLLDAGVGLTLVNRHGKLRGRLRSAISHNLPLRRKQYACGQDVAFCLEISRAIVKGKLANSRTLAMRILRRLKKDRDNRLAGLEAQLQRLTHVLNKTSSASSADELRGYEGEGTKAYFAILRAGLRWQGNGFEKRTRRPPKDPVNALLSLGYTLLGDAVYTAIEVVGLDPYAGFLHTDRPGRPALALDLMEEFRSIIVDSNLLTLLNKRMLGEKDFKPGDKGGVFLTRRGLRVFFKQFTKRLNTRLFHPIAERSLSYQKCFEVQAWQIRKVVEGKTDRYQSILTK